MAKSKNEQLLTKLEFEVMRGVWSAGASEASSIREILDRVNEHRDPPLAYTTVQTVVGILKGKGWLLVRRGKERAHRYAPRIAEDIAQRSFVGDLLKRVFDGKVKPLFTHLLENDAFDRDDLHELRQLIDQHLNDEVAR